MRFMMFIYPNPETEAGLRPCRAEEVAVMMKFNKEMLDAGVMLTGEGLHPTSKGARVRFKNGKPHVTDGPFTETKEVIGGYWMLKVNSREEAIEWAKRVPIEDETRVHRAATGLRHGGLPARRTGGGHPLLTQTPRHTVISVAAVTRSKTTGPPQTSTPASA